MKNGKYLAPKERNPYGIYIGILATLIAIAAVVLGILFLFPGTEEAPAMEYEKKETTAAQQETEPTEAPEEPEPTTPTEPVVEEEEQPSVAHQQAQQLLSQMTEEEKIYQLFIVTPEQLVNYQANPVVRSGETTKACIEKYPVGGVVYFSANLVDREQTTKMISDLQSYTKLGLFIAVDEEGGNVVRIGDNSAMGTTWVPKMQEVGSSGDVEQARAAGKTLGSEIGALGFNLDFAPVADVNSNPSNTVIGNRAFSSDPKMAAEMVRACVEGFQETNTLCTLKHFPGHGDTAADSHYGAAQSNKTLEELRECEFLPFQAGIEAGAEFVMVGHVSLPSVTGDNTPATVSKQIVTGLLREELGFQGIVITDAMNMGAITNMYSSADATVKALQAGVDMILMPNDFSASVKGVQDALANGDLTTEQIDEKVLRILETKIEAGIIVVEE